ncbi:fungal protein [Schizosaccharomyces cryophilus OY26]|uniref:Fungal protein n=1 Tax=Schizosaccharomyces cryophilus (strain OY26 / ATCC MYA-4695 / CBS 11777 / NBRC 106824 / NRRL Y48691) TaxID=653667 RepID=S9VR18_SCHCR|nr:uncharacterized protein SPOG_01131 [Schizosaccharomyces cryophilus OY26]EPY50373.1 fungal protein [Schizosaccharomyces cryophilus OY26]
MEQVKISRKDLQQQKEEPEVEESSEAASKLLSQRLSSVFDFAVEPRAVEESPSANTLENVESNLSEAKSENEDENVAFNLFSDINTISLNDKEVIVNQGRPVEYYILQDSSERQARLHASVFTFEQLMKAKDESWPGCQKPHKVVNIKIDDEKKNRRWRPSKKRRIRMKILKEKEKQDKLRKTAFQKKGFSTKKFNSRPNPNWQRKRKF